MGAASHTLVRTEREMSVLVLELHLTALPLDSHKESVVSPYLWEPIGHWTELLPPTQAPQLLPSCG